MKINEVTSGQVAKTADTVQSTAGLGQLGASLGGKVASKLAPASSIGSKFARFVPGLGLVASGADAVRRASAGDWTGAGLSAASGITGMFPGLGTAASLGLTGYQAYRDKQRTGSYMPDADEIAKASGKGAEDGFGDPNQPAQEPAPTAPTVPPGGDPKVYALQQQLIAKGAKITADGKMGSATQTAMKQFGIKENTMSNSEKMAQIRDRLIQIEQEKNQPLNEGAWDSLKGAASNIGKAWNWGAKNAGAAASLKNAPNATAVQKVANTAAKTAGAMSRNPLKTAAGAAALGAGAGYLAGRPSNGGGQKPAPTPPKPRPPGPKPAPTAGGLTPEELAELDAIAAEWEQINDPTILNLLGAYGQVRQGLAAPKGPAAVPSTVANQPGTAKQADIQ